MLTTTKKTKMLNALKTYKKSYLDKKYDDLDESATRVMVNHLLSEVLGFKMIDEIKTEYMIRGTYADYVVQMKGVRHFLVEVKALGLDLNEKHLRQAINYGANEGIEWAVLTNAKRLELYKILFEKPINYKKVLSIDFADTNNLKADIEMLQFLHRDSISKGELNILWKKHTALNPKGLASYLFGKPVINYIKRELKAKYKSNFSDGEIFEALKQMLSCSLCMEDIKPIKSRKKKETDTISKLEATTTRETNKTIVAPTT